VQQPDANPDANSNADALQFAFGSVNTNRNQSEFHQLYSELERRNRCDRLSVGRIHKQQFHYLRTRLPEFGRRKHDPFPRDRVKSVDDILLPGASIQWMCYERQFQRQKCKDDGLHPCRSVNTNRNQCEFQQFFRELERRKRCDRLSAGRIHK
jgi:hypothetical protein